MEAIKTAPAETHTAQCNSSLCSLSHNFRFLSCVPTWSRDHGVLRRSHVQGVVSVVVVPGDDRVRLHLLVAPHSCPVGLTEDKVVQFHTTDTSRKTPFLVTQLDQDTEKTTVQCSVHEVTTTTLFVCSLKIASQTLRNVVSRNQIFEGS